MFEIKEQMRVSTFFLCCLISLQAAGLALAAPRSVYCFDYDDQIESRGIDPTKKIAQLIASNPKSRYIRYRLKFTGTNSFYINDVLFDRKYKTLTFHGFSRVNGNESKIYYRFYSVNGTQLKRWIRISNQRNSGGLDMDLFLLADLGCPMKDLHIGKMRDHEDVPDY